MPTVYPYCLSLIHSTYTYLGEWVWGKCLNLLFRYISKLFTEKWSGAKFFLGGAALSFSVASERDVSSDHMGGNLDSNLPLEWIIVIIVLTQEDISS